MRFSKLNIVFFMLVIVSVFGYGMISHAKFTKSISVDMAKLKENNVILAQNKEVTQDSIDSIIESDMERIPDEESIIESEPSRIPDLEGQSEAFGNDSHLDQARDLGNDQENQKP